MAFHWVSIGDGLQINWFKILQLHFEWFWFFVFFARYPGFSEAEVRYKYADFKQPKVMDWRKREKKKKAALKLQEKKIEQATKGNEVKVTCHCSSAKNRYWVIPIPPVLFLKRKSHLKNLIRANWIDTDDLF